MPLRTACLAALILSLAASAQETPPKNPALIEKGVFYTRMHGQEVSRESFELRDGGWWAKGKLDLFGQQKSEYELTEKIADGKKVFAATFLQSGKPVELKGTLGDKAYDLVAIVDGEEKKASVSLEGKFHTQPYVNLVWVFYVDIGRELVSLATGGQLVAGTKIDLVDIGSVSQFDLRVREHKVLQKPVGSEVVPLYLFEVTVAGSVDARLLTNAKGIPIWFDVPAQKLTTFVEGFESFVPESAVPHTIVDSGAWREKLSKPEHAIVREENVKVPMRDGVKLAADVFRPEKPGKYPTVLARTPYSRKGEGILRGNYYAQRGYAVVVQDVRGRFDSEGEFRPVFNEANDGSDTLDWIAAQPWSDGNVGMIGASYVGWVQWLAATTGNPHLKAIVPEVAPPDPHENIPYEGGVFCLSTAWWAVAAEAIAAGGGLGGGKIDWMKAMATLPITELDTALGVKKSPFVDEWISHPPEDPYWEPIRYQRRFASIDVPSLNISGWYDGDQPGAPMNFAGMRKNAKSAKAREGTMLVMGPWTHIFNTSPRLGDYDFGADAVVDLDALSLRFFDRHLKGVENGIEKEDPVLVFTMFENAWHREKDWPLPQTNWTKLYLGGPGAAKKRDGGGALALEPADGPPDRYAYDPHHQPTRKVDFDDLSGKSVSEDAYADGDDESVLDYVSPPLAEAVEVTGPVSVTLSVTTDAVDTDFAAVILRFDKTGKAHGVRAGIQRLKYRNGWNKPSLAKPGEVATVTIDCWATGLRFEKGERIGLMIASELFPGYAKNLNTGEPDTTAVKGVVANQTVFHDKARPSFLTLPVIPRDGKTGAIRFDSAPPAPGGR